MTRRRKAWIGGGVAAALVALIAVGFARGRGGDAVEVETEVVRARDLVSIVTASGELQPQTSVDVNANVNGTIELLAVREGQTVAAGDFLLRIDPVSAEAATEAQRARSQAARRQVEALGVELAQARRDAERARSLAARDLAPQEELQRAESAVARLEAQVAGGRSQVEEAEAILRGNRHELSKVTVTAPASGVVTRLNVEQGESALSTSLTPTLLLTIADLSTMEAEIEVDETDVVNVRTGQTATITVDAFPDTTFAGTVTEVGTSPIAREGLESQAARDAKDFKVVVTLTDSLPAGRAGLSATADIETARREGAVAAPIQSVVVREIPRARLGEAPPDTLGPGEETEGVFAVREGEARFVPVDVGITGDRFFEVRSGLADGDTVVSGTYEALRDLQDGDPVKIQKPERGDGRRRERGGETGGKGRDGEQS